MAFTVAQSYNASAECAAASSFTNLRVMSVTQGGAPTPQKDFGPYGIRLPWSRASAQTVCGGDFDYVSAVGYFFARDLHLALGTAAMPVGLIVSSVPGTAIEAWSSPEVLEACTDRADSTLWNNMIVPLLGVGIRGAVWYQGEGASIESNSSRWGARDQLAPVNRNAWHCDPAPPFSTITPLLSQRRGLPLQLYVPWHDRGLAQAVAGGALARRPRLPFHLHAALPVLRPGAARLPWRGW